MSRASFGLGADSLCEFRLSASRREDIFEVTSLSVVGVLHTKSFPSVLCGLRGSAYHYYPGSERER